MSGTVLQVTVHAGRGTGQPTVARVEGEIDIANADELHDRLAAVLEGASALVVDLTGVTYMDSQALKVMADLARAAAEGAVSLVAPRHSIAGELLAITALDQLIAVRPTNDAS
jgi:anti-sigma B factor antagonist